MILPLSSGMSRSLESVLGSPQVKIQTAGGVRVDPQGQLLPNEMVARSVVMQQDPRRFSEASITPPPRPPPPNLKRLKQPQMVIRDRRPAVHPAVPGSSWPPQTIQVPQPQPQPQLQPQPLQGVAVSNLAKMAHMARSTPQLDDQLDTKERERVREREKERYSQVQHIRDAVITQVGQGEVFILFYSTYIGVCLFLLSFSGV